MSNDAFQYMPTTGTTNYAVADANNGYTSSGGTTFSYDGNRNLTFDGINTLTYDVENRLIQAQTPAWGTVPYLYDPLGNRKQKQVGTVVTQFVVAGGEEIADYSDAGWTLTVRGVGGLPVAAITPATGNQSEYVVYYHHDGTGSTVAATTAGSSNTEVYTYGEFGASGAGTWATYRYAGYRYDNETGLYYVNARYYSPTLGRFLQTDPIGLSGGTNLYAYVGNDPINGIDPTGLSRQEQGNDSGSVPSCKSLSLNNPNTFWNDSFATPAQVDAFFQTTNSPASWDGGEAAAAFTAAGINPGWLLELLVQKHLLATMDSRQEIPMIHSAQADQTLTAHCLAA